MDYTDFLVHNCPKTVFYIPNFITSEDEQRILNQVENAPKPKWTQLAHRRLLNYGGVPHPKGMIAEEIPLWLQNFVDKINHLGIFESNRANHVLVNEYLPGQGIMPHTDGPLFYPTISTISCGSHTVLEFYKPETRDNVGPTYSEVSSVPTANSTESGTSTNNSGHNTTSNSENTEAAEKHRKHLACKIMVEPRSLLLIKDEMYHDYMHSISEITEDLVCDHICNLNNCEISYKFGDRIKRKKRISLTIRHVPKTTKLKLKFCP